MVTYTVIKKDGSSYNVTTDNSKRTTIRTGSGFGTGGSPTVYDRSSGRKSETATVKEITPKPEEEVKTQKLEVNQSSKQNTQSQSITNPNVNANEQFQTRLVSQAPPNIITDGGVNQGSINRINVPEFSRFNIEDYKIYQADTRYKPTFKNFFDLKFDTSLKNFGDIKKGNENALRIDKVFNYFYEEEGAKSIKRDSQGDFVASQINPSSSAKAFISGVGSSLFTPLYNPKETLEGTAQAIGNPSEAISNIKTEAQNNPFGFAGQIYGGTKGINIATKGIIRAKDYLRTAGRTELPRSSVTTPEVIFGEQTFPYSPLTPEELAKQFIGESPYVKNIQKIYGSEKPLGFSASPQPLKGNKVLSRTEIQDFSSASSGLYQAPSLSEWFLKIRKGESSKYSLFPDISGNPTINIVKSSDVKTFPKNVVNQAKKSSNPVEYLNDYAIKNFKEGESFVSPEYTLGKTESEILLKAGTEFNVFESQTGNKYFVNIEGRRVPVTAIEPKKSSSLGTTKTLQEISKEFAETRSSLLKPTNNKNLFEDYIKLSVPNIKPSNIITTTGNLPDPSNSISSITSSTAYNPNYTLFPDVVFQSPSSIIPISDYTIKLSPSSNPVSQSLGKNIFGSSQSLSPSRTLIGGSGGGGSSSRGSSGGSSGLFVPPSSQTPQNSGSSSIIPPSSASSSITNPSRSTTRGGSSYNIFRGSNSIIPSTSRGIYGSSKNKNTQAFDVYVRRKGRFFKENPQPLTKQSAINFGTFTVGSDSSATFKLKNVFGKPTTFLRSGNLQNFYKKGNLFIEKKEKRIKRTSPLELQQITFKGIATNKARSKKIKNIFGGGL